MSKLVRWRSCGRWHRFSIDGAWLHQFYAGAIGIKQVRLTFPIYAHLDLDRPGVGLSCRPGLEHGNSPFDIRCDQTNMVLAAQLCWRRWILIEHEFNVIVTVGHAHVYPAYL